MTDLNELKAEIERSIKDAKAMGYALSGHEIIGIVRNLEKALDALPAWISVDERRPSPGERVACLRSNGSWDRGEFACLGAEALGEWYMPEGPVECASWSRSEHCITHWTPLPTTPTNKEQTHD